MKGEMRGVDGSDAPTFSIPTVSLFTTFSYQIDPVALEAIFTMVGFPTGTDEYQFKHKVITQQDSLGSNDQTFYMSCIQGNCV